MARPIYSTTTSREKEEGSSEKCEFWVCQKFDIIRSVTKSNNITAQFSASWPQQQCSVSSRHSSGSIGLSTFPLQGSEVAGPHISEHTESRDRQQHCLPSMPDMDKNSATHSEKAEPLLTNCHSMAWPGLLPWFLPSLLCKGSTCLGNAMVQQVQKTKPFLFIVEARICVLPTIQTHIHPS